MKAYGSCAGFAATGALGFAGACEIIAAPIVESHLGDLKKEVHEVQQRLHHIGDLFGKLHARCDALKKVAHHEHKSLTLVQGKLNSEKYFISHSRNSAHSWNRNVFPLTKKLVAFLREKARA